MEGRNISEAGYRWDTRSMGLSPHGSRLLLRTGFRDELLDARDNGLKRAEWMEDRFDTDLLDHLFFGPGDNPAHHHRDVENAFGLHLIKQDGDQHLGGGVHDSIADNIDILLDGGLNDFFGRLDAA